MRDYRGRTDAPAPSEKSVTLGSPDVPDLLDFWPRRWTRKIVHMARSHYVFGYDAEPADERPTDYGTTGFGASGMVSLATAPAPWSVTEHSTFDAPSRSSDMVRQRRERRRLKRSVVMLLSLLAAIAAAAAAVFVTRS